MRLSRPLGALALLAMAFGLNNPWLRFHPWTAVFLWALASFIEEALASRRSLRPWHEARPAPLLFFGSLALYLANFHWKGGDDIPNSVLPFCVLRHGTLSLEPVRALFMGDLKSDFVVEGPRGLLSVYPVASGILALPVYAPAVLAGAQPDWELVHNLSKISASLISAASVVVFHRVAARRASPSWSAGVAVLYALGTYTFSVSSQALYQHGPGQLGVLLGLAGLLAPGQPSSSFIAGFGFAFAAAARVDAAFYLLGACAVLALRERKRLLHFLFGAAAPLLPLAGYWLYYTGRLAPPESRLQAHLFGAFQPEAVLGMLISPTRGALFFTPAALFGVWALWRAWRRGEAAALALLAASAATWALFWFRPSWTAGGTFGNRYFATVSAVLALACADLEETVRSSAFLRGVWSAAFSVSVLVHACGAFFRWPGHFSLVEQAQELWDLALWPPFAAFSSSGTLSAFPAPARWAAAGAFCMAVLGLGRAACAATCLRPDAPRR